MKYFMKPGKWFDVVLLLVGLAGLLGPATARLRADDVTNQLAYNAIEKGVSWLIANQQPNGSWYNDPAVTGFGVLVLLNWDYDDADPAVVSALQYILSYMNPNGSVGPEYHRYTYRTSIAAMALAATHNDSYDDELTLMRQWLIDSQWDEVCYYGGVNTDHWYYGGFGYGNSSRPDLSNTQWALMGLKMADNALGLNAGTAYDKCADYFLKRCQNPDGGSYYVPGGGSIHTMTAASVWSYALCGRDGSTELQQGLDWLTANYNVDSASGWGSLSDYYYAVTFAKALNMCMKVKLGGHDWYPDLVQELASEQFPAGNWPAKGWGYGSELDTCWALLALQARYIPEGPFHMKIELCGDVDLHLYDFEGRHVGPAPAGYENQIPNTTVVRNGNCITIDVNKLRAGMYNIELVGVRQGAFDITISGINDNEVRCTKRHQAPVMEGEWLGTWVLATAMEGVPTLIYGPWRAIPILSLSPNPVKLQGKPGITVAGCLSLKELAGKEPVKSVTLYATDVVGQKDTILGNTIVFQENDFDLGAGQEKVVHFSVPIPSDFLGSAEGMIVVESYTLGARKVRLLVNSGCTYPHAEIGGPYRGTVGQPITFNAGKSYDPDGPIPWYRWEWHIDPSPKPSNIASEMCQSCPLPDLPSVTLDTICEWSTRPVCQHTWHSAFSGKIRMSVMDEDGLNDWADAYVVVTGPQTMLQMVLKSHADLHVYDPQNRHVGVRYETGTVERRIPDSTFAILDEQGNVMPWTGGTPGEGLQQVVTLPVYAGGKYCLKLVGTSDGPFELEVAGTQDGQLVAQKVYSGGILKGEVIPLCLTARFTDGSLKVELPPLVYPPVMQVAPGETKLTVEAAKSYACAITVKEVRGVTPLQGVTLECTEVKGPARGIQPSDITFDLSGFDIAAGGEQVVHAYVSVPKGFMGKTTAVLTVKSTNGGERSVNVVLKTAGKLLPFAEANGPYRGVAGQPITFDASGSYDPDGDIAFYGWDWDADYQIDEYAYTPTCTHTWPSAGTRTVVLFIYDEDNMINLDDTQVVVEP